MEKSLILLVALAIGCGSAAPALPPIEQLGKAEAAFDFYGFEVRSLEAQLQTDNKTFYIDNGTKTLTRSEAEEALTEARRELAGAKVTIDRITREIEQSSD